MKGDFSRVTFDPTKHFSRVLKQQGRVALDADDNEQSAILLHYLRTLARDLIGPYGVAAPGAFQVSAVGNDLKLTPGHIYVDGILVENEAVDWGYLNQKDYPLSENDALKDYLKDQPVNGAFWVYLDVWERHVTALEDDDIREKALVGPDTCTRAKVVWQVKGVSVDTIPNDAALCSAEPPTNLVSISPATMAAQTKPGPISDDPCIIAPDSRYRGAENQLYRVEIHRGNLDDDSVTPTFKWSRDNGSIVTSWLGPSEQSAGIRVSKSRGFKAGNWVEISDDGQDLRGEPGSLVRLTKVEGEILSVDPTASLPNRSEGLSNPKVRRWDQVEVDDIELQAGAIEIVEEEWIDLEDGLQVWFGPGGKYRTGDYWLIPARVETGKIEWPPAPPNQGKALVSPHGVEHHYAPLGYIRREGDNWESHTCQCVIHAPVECDSLQGSELIAPSGKPAKPSRRRSKSKP